LVNITDVFPTTAQVSVTSIFGSSCDFTYSGPCRFKISFYVPACFAFYTKDIIITNTATNNALFSLQDVNNCPIVDRGKFTIARTNSQNPIKKYQITLTEVNANNQPVLNEYTRDFGWVNNQLSNRTIAYASLNLIGTEVVFQPNKRYLVRLKTDDGCGIDEDTKLYITDPLLVSGSVPNQISVCSNLSFANTTTACFDRMIFTLTDWNQSFTSTQMYANQSSYNLRNIFPQLNANQFNIFSLTVTGVTTVQTITGTVTITSTPVVYTIVQYASTNFQFKGLAPAPATTLSYVTPARI
jgi:hypothetical protein